MKHTLTRFTAISVTAAALVAGGMLSSAASADTASASAGPVTTQSTWVVAVYATSAECRYEGSAMLVNKLIKSYQCLWDSPGFALWVTK